MAIFDSEGQAQEVSLSDEAIYGSVEDRQETKTEAPEQEDNIENTEETTGETIDVQTVNTASEQEEEQVGTTEHNTELERLQKQYSDLRAWTTKVAQENSRLRKSQAETPAAPVEPKEPKDFLRDFVNGGEDGLNQLIEKKAKELVQPILSERQEAERRERFNTAFKDTENGWSQLADNANRRSMIEEMVNISAREGNPDAWKDNPDYYMFRACRSLWGTPKIVDHDAIEAAKKATREAVIKEYEEKQKKSGLTIQTTANKDGRKEQLTPEQEIADSIMNVGSSGLFR